MTKRAQEPLEVGHGGGYGALNGVTIRNREGYVAAVAIADVPELDAGALARRIVACVNACAGIPTEALESARWSRPGDAP